MNPAFYVAAAAAVAAAAMAISRLNAVHALLYLVVSLLASAVAMYTLGAAFAAALEVIVYAGAIMVLFLFVVMMLGLGPEVGAQERRWFHPRMVAGPAALALVLLAELVVVLASDRAPAPAGGLVGPKRVGVALLGPYVLAVELASLVLLAGLVGAYHLGQKAQQAGPGDRGAMRARPAEPPAREPARMPVPLHPREPSGAR